MVEERGMVWAGVGWVGRWEGGLETGIGVGVAEWGGGDVLNIYIVI